MAAEKQNASSRKQQEGSSTPKEKLVESWAFLEIAFQENIMKKKCL